MPLTTDYYALLSRLFHHMATMPDTPVVIPLDQWPTDSLEKLLLEEFQMALTAVQLQAETRKREQSTLLEISQTLASALVLRPGLILDQLRILVEYSYAVLFALEELSLVTLAARGSKQIETAMPFRIQLESPESLTILLNDHQPQRITDVWGAGRAANYLRSFLGRQADILLEGVHSWMWVPLVINGQIIGGIGIAHAEPDAFTAHDADLALTIANQAAITLINAQLYEQAQALAALEERQRLAQNLHDAVNQSLFSASLIAEVLPRLWERNPDEGRRSLQDLRRLTRGALAEMRGLLVELQPLALTDTDLGDLLYQLGNALMGRTNIVVDVTVVGEAVLPADTQVILYRLCQEALRNIEKHARASQVVIHLQYAMDIVEINIRDNGRGFDPENTPPGHYGLSIMRERAEALGALLSITSQLGDGTEIVIRWTKLVE